MPDAPDRDLLERFVRGDREAFEALYRRHQQEVFQWALRVVRNRSAAEDVVVEAFWRAYRSHARFDPARRFGAWMRRVTMRVAIDHLNAVRRRAWVPLVERTTRSEGRTPRDGAPPSATADTIAYAFRALSPKLQVVATLALIEEQPLAEIADALDLPVGTIKSRLFRATQQLRKELSRMGIQG